MSEAEKTARAMAALDAMAEMWAAKFHAAGTNLRGAVRTMLLLPDAEDRLLRLIKQAHAEGLFEGFHAGKERATAAFEASLSSAVSGAPGARGADCALVCQEHSAGRKAGVPACELGACKRTLGETAISAPPLPVAGAARRRT